MKTKFYASFPVLYNDNIIFVTNNNLYLFDTKTASTSLLLSTSRPITHLKIDQDTLIFTSEFEGGPDLYSMNLNNLSIERLTFSDNHSIKAINFQNNKIIYVSNEDTPFRILQAYELDLSTKNITQLEYTDIHSYHYYKNDVIVEKNGYGYLFWKNYQGGLKASIYKNNEILIDLPGQCVNPVIYKDKIFFIYEENDHTNIFSCDLHGQQLTQHTQHTTYKLQNLFLSKDKIIYSQIGKIFIFDITQNTTKEISIPLNITLPTIYQDIELNYLTSIENNHKEAVCCIRGNIFVKNLYSGNFKQISHELRYVVSGFINNQIFGIKDGRHTELHIFKENNTIIKHQLDPQKILRVQVSSTHWIAYSNHKNELHIINEEGKNILVAQHQMNIKHFEWSSDGKFLAYALPNEYNTSLVLYSLEQNSNQYLVRDEYHNTSPTFDPNNEYLAFLSNRNLYATEEELKFDYHIQIKTNAFYIPLKKMYNMKHPWIEKPELSNEWDLMNPSDKIAIIPISKTLKKIIALEDRIYGIIQTKQKRLVKLPLDTLIEEIEREKHDQILITNNKQSIIYISESDITIHPIKEKPEKKHWKNIKLSLMDQKSTITQDQELANIFEELTWLMEEFFWDGKQINKFKHIIAEYSPFLETIHTSHELYELLNQIQGEMKTSHSYVYSPYNYSKKGYLGIKTDKNHRITSFVPSIKKNIEHPILSLNHNIQKNDKLISINGQPINNLQKLLLNNGTHPMSLTIENSNQEIIEHDITPLSFKNHKKTIYENWTNDNEKYIHTYNPNIGYIHINDMMSSGFVNFFIKYLNNYNKAGIIIDARYNTGGHISTLLLEQLNKKKTGLDKSRHFGDSSIPRETTNGKYVLLINANTASDGEIFAENFKRMKLGIIIGEKTWGGVVGIAPRYFLINNLLTTQPEFGTSFFQDEKNPTNAIENHGVTPDILIHNPIKRILEPNTDLQLQRAIEEIKKII